MAAPQRETERLAILKELEILDTLPEKALDDLTLLASHICEAPIALLTLLDDKRQWFKSRVGLAVAETPIEMAFCAHAIDQQGLFVVPDAEHDPRFSQNPLVRGDPNIRFYAGSPLVMDNGFALGTLCVIDRVPREMTAGQREALEALGREVVTHLELRRTVSRLRQTQLELQRAQSNSENLLLAVLPESIARRLMRGEQHIADSFDQVSILFADIDDFASIADRESPVQLVEQLDRIFSTFDELVDRHQLEKIKTVGDAYMVAGGLPDPRPNHLQAMADLALDMQAAIGRISAGARHVMSLRIGIHSGPVTAGVIGKRRFAYDLWGQTVSTAAHMESMGLPGSIQVSGAVYAQLKDRYLFEERGEFYIKGSGNVDTYLLEGRRR